MVGSRERQPHIHSISKCNDGNLAFADYLPMIVWPAKLSCKPDMFCDLQHWSLPVFVSKPILKEVDEAELNELIMRLILHFYLTCQVCSWRTKQFMNVILQTLSTDSRMVKKFNSPPLQKLNLEECNQKTLHIYAAIQVNMVDNTDHALPSKGHLAWCPVPNYDSSLYTLIHHMQSKLRPHNNHLQWDK